MSPREQRTSNRNVGRARSRKGQQASSAMQRITFVDHGAPNVRSTIQRHTAYHSNAQRRAARLASLRNPSRPRVLEWTRRADQPETPGATTNPATTVSSEMGMPPLEIPVIPVADFDAASMWEHSTNVSQSEVVNADEETALINYLLQNICSHVRRKDIFREIIEFAQSNEACLQLLLAYSLFLRKHHGHSSDPELDQQRAQACLSSGRVLLADSLRYPGPTTTDETMQAILLMIAITADFGDYQELGLHQQALRQVMAVRSTDGWSEVIQIQLRAIWQARTFHLTLYCDPQCMGALRFRHE